MEVTFYRGSQNLGVFQSEGVALGVVSRAYMQMAGIDASWFVVTMGQYRYVGHATDMKRDVKDVVASINRAFGGSEEKAA